MKPDHFALSVSSCAICLVTVYYWYKNKKSQELSPYYERKTKFVHINDLRNPAIREDHVAFNKYLHGFPATLIPVQGVRNTFIAYRYADIREISTSKAFTSHPFPDNRLIGLSTMDDDRHQYYSSLLRKHYSYTGIQGILESLPVILTKHMTTDLVYTMNMFHMETQLAMLGFTDPDLDLTKRMVFYNNVAVKLVAPLGGVGSHPGNRKNWLAILKGMVGAIPSALRLAMQIGLLNTWRLLRPELALFQPSEMHHHPGDLHWIPKYLIELNSLCVSQTNGILQRLRDESHNRAECLAITAQLMVNMTSRNALLNLVDRLLSKAGPADESKEVFIWESLRVTAPLMRNPRRVVAENKFGIPKGSSVLMFIGAGNVDPSYFPEAPERRMDSQVSLLTFGFGIHKCLGKKIVMAELDAVYEYFINRPVKTSHFKRLTDVDVGNYGFDEYRVCPQST